MTGPPPVRVFAPATVGNVICGFDVFGLALEAPGDEVVARRTGPDGVRLVEISGDGGRLPRDPERNAASVAAAGVLRHSGRDGGLELTLHKGLPIASGMGGSAASAVAGAVAANAALEAGLGTTDLLTCALEGERAAVGTAHADNVAPCLLGGLVLVRPGSPPDAVPLPIPRGLTVALVHPPLELETSAGRQALPGSVPLSTAIATWANTAGLVAGLATEDWALVTRSLVDHVAEPVRAGAVPGFEAARIAALAAGALGAGLSGSGPSLFALCRSMSEATAAGEGMARSLEEAGLTGVRVYASPVASRGARVVTGPNGAPP